jgi:hypothetical protein
MALATDQTQFKINLRHLGKLYKNFLPEPCKILLDAFLQRHILMEYQLDRITCEKQSNPLTARNSWKP